MKFKTIHNEHKFVSFRPIQHVAVRPKQVPSLKNIIEMAHKGTAPTNLKFAEIANSGFIPPQYSGEDITQLHARYNHLKREHELSQSRPDKPQAVQPPTPVVSEPQPVPDGSALPIT